VNIKTFLHRSILYGALATGLYYSASEVPLVFSSQISYPHTTKQEEVKTLDAHLRHLPCSLSCDTHVKVKLVLDETVLSADNFFEAENNPERALYTTFLYAIQEEEMTWRSTHYEITYQLILRLNKEVKEHFQKHFSVCLDFSSVEKCIFATNDIEKIFDDEGIYLPKGETDLVVILSRNSSKNKNNSVGKAVISGNHCAVAGQRFTTYLHELGHIFGARHVEEKSSFMHVNSISRSHWDSKSHKVIMANKVRFKKKTPTFINPSKQIQ